MNLNNRWKKIAFNHFNHPEILSATERALCELINKADGEFRSRIKKGFPELHKLLFECKNELESMRDEKCQITKKH